MGKLHLFGRRVHNSDHGLGWQRVMTTNIDNNDNWTFTSLSQQLGFHLSMDSLVPPIIGLDLKYVRTAATADIGMLNVGLICTTSSSGCRNTSSKTSLDTTRLLAVQSKPAVELSSLWTSFCVR